MRALAGLGVLLLLALPTSQVSQALGTPGAGAGAGGAYSWGRKRPGEQIKSLAVIAEEYNLFQKDKQEQKIPVSKIIHPEYNRLGYMSSDIAQLYLKHKVKFGISIQPIHLPHGGDTFEEGILCMTSGWSKISESKVCGDTLPPPLLTESREAIVTLVSDREHSGSSFEPTFPAAQKNSDDSGCRSVTTLVGEEMIHYSSYPDLHPKNLRHHGFIHAPEKHVVKSYLGKLLKSDSPEVGLEYIYLYEAQLVSGNYNYCLWKNNPVFWTVIAGDHDRTLKEPTEQVRKAEHIVVHKDLERSSFASDIVLMQLGSPWSSALL
uniref:Ovochymase 1 n=1 Tax=Molossus molossus TaxID=27622 RepID=A0A7J8G0C2_MOLMO|nr:ovochymase 1 [Molossus molossus]